MTHCERVTMRVLALTTSFPLRPEASTGVFVRRLYEHLPSDWSIDVVCPADDEPTEPVVRGTRINVYSVRYAPARWRLLAQQPGGIVPSIKESPWRFLLAPLLLLGLGWRCSLRAKHCDVVHANWAICGAIASAVAVLHRRPVVTTLRGDDVARAAHSWIDRQILRMAVRGSTFIVCVSEAMAHDLRKRYPDRGKEIEVCLNGVDPAFLAVVRTPAKHGRLRIVAVGSLIQRKGYDVLIDAIATMRYRDAVEVTVAGAGPELRSLQDRATQRGVFDRLKFVGELAPAGIPELLADADVFVLASRSEGRPNVVIEALAAGLPVVSSALPGVDGLVQPGVNGWCAAVDDAVAFAAALDEAFADRAERERRGAAARDRILRGGYTWAITSHRYETVFRRALLAHREGAN